MKLAILKTQIIITDPDDTVLHTNITGHPSIGKPDEVVWKYAKNFAAVFDVKKYS